MGPGPENSPTAKTTNLNDFILCNAMQISEYIKEIEVNKPGTSKIENCSWSALNSRK